MYHQIDGIAGAFGFMHLVRIDDRQITLLKLQFCVFKIAGYPTLHKHEQFHRLMPMGRDIGTEIIFIFYAKAGFIHGCQDPVLVIFALITP
jgi:hypothetical protein